MKFDKTAHKHLKRHSNGVFYCTVGGEERSLRTKDEAVALIRADLLRAEIRFAGELAIKYRVNDLFTEYLDVKRDQRDGKIPRARKLASTTFREIDDIFKNHLLPTFGNYRLSQITSGAWARYCDKSVVSDLKNHRKVLQGFLKWCMRKDLMRAVPDISHIPFHKRRTRKIIKPNELEKIYSHAEGSLLLFLSLALYNGLRRKEAMTLTKSAVNLKDRYIVVLGRHNKRNRERAIPINETVAKLLEERFHDLQRFKVNSEWIFPNHVDPKRHAHLGGLKTAWKTVLKKSDLKDITWHDLRATFEKHMNTRTDFTDVQKEKFADATMAVQKRIYVTMDQDDLRGIENSVNLPKLEEIIAGRIKSDRKTVGKRGFE